MMHAEQVEWGTAWHKRIEVPQYSGEGGQGSADCPPQTDAATLTSAGMPADHSSIPIAQLIPPNYQPSPPTPPPGWHTATGKAGQSAATHPAAVMLSLPALLPLLMLIARGVVVERMWREHIEKQMVVAKQVCVRHGASANLSPPALAPSVPVAPAPALGLLALGRCATATAAGASIAAGA